MATDEIKFGTDGWRAIIGLDFTVHNVARVSAGLAAWLNGRKKDTTVVVGHDCRFGGQMFAETVAAVLCSEGIKVILAEGFVSTPMISLAVYQLGADQGVIITASHNPPAYNGFKLKGAHGGPTSPAEVAQVEALIPETMQMPDRNIAHWMGRNLLQVANLEELYVNYLATRFDFGALNRAPGKLAYDAMYGAGQAVMRRILPRAVLLHCDENPGFHGQAPEPLDRNLRELSHTIAMSPEIKIGVATDGDADRIGIYDEDGNFVDAHHIILLLIHYLVKYKGLSGKVVIAFSVTDRVKTLCAHYGIPVVVTPIGFKYISEIMVHDDVLLGGEESGGIAVKGHIPERDGIYDGLLMYEFMSASGKTVKELCQEIYGIVGTFFYERHDLHIDNKLKEHIITTAYAGGYARFGKYTYHRTETIDGIKFHLDGGGWVMLRASGTEPLLRVYAEGNNREHATDILEEVKKVVL